MAVEQNKPNGYFIINKDQQEIDNYLDNVKVRKIPGIGLKYETIFKELGIETIQDLK